MMQQLRNILLSLILIACNVPSLFAQIINEGNQKGLFSGRLILNGIGTANGSTSTAMHGDWWFDQVVISTGNTIIVDTYLNTVNGSGKLLFHANIIIIEGKIDACRRGYEGGQGQRGGSGGIGGIGGINGGDGQSGSPGENASEGLVGYGSVGGTGGLGKIGTCGYGGLTGTVSVYGGPPRVTLGGDGGLSGLGADNGFIGRSGGYFMQGINGDSSKGFFMTIGSGGGGGGGGAGGGGSGGAGGNGNDVTHIYVQGARGNNGGLGGKGGEGGNGGGLVELFCNYQLSLTGTIDTSGGEGLEGANGANPNNGGGAGGQGGCGGNGAGGGILLYCPQKGGLELNGNLFAFGGNSNTVNGGTIKIFSPDITSLLQVTELEDTCGRVFIDPHLVAKPDPPELISPTDDYCTMQNMPAWTDIALKVRYASQDDLKGRVNFKVSTCASFSNTATIVYDAISTTLVGHGTEVGTVVSLASSTATASAYFWCAQDINEVGTGSEISRLGRIEILPAGEKWLPNLVSLTPGAAHLNQTVKMTVDGSRFQTGVLAFLSRGGVRLPAQADSYQYTGSTRISCSFDLAQAPAAGEWSLYVGNSISALSNELAFSILPPEVITPTPTPTASPTPLPVETMLTVRNTLVVPSKPCAFNFTLQEDTRVFLTLYNLRGEKICALIDGENLPRGYYRREWQGVNTRGTQVASGIYLAKFKAGNYQKMFKVAVVR